MNAPPPSRPFLQCGRMFPLVAAVGMARTAPCGHRADGAESRPAVFAGIAAFLVAFVELVLAPVASCRVTRTTPRRQRIHRRIPGPAMLAIEVCHFSISFPFWLFGSPAPPWSGAALLIKQIPCQIVFRAGRPPGTGHSSVQILTLCSKSYRHTAGFSASAR